MRVDELADAVRAGDRRALARAITLVESSRGEHRRDAEALLERLAPHAGGATRLGITGAPGVGKSTFIDALGQLALAQGQRVAVLSIDPSSQISGGSILGDKTRMTALSRQANAFVRPSPAGDTLGGVHRRTRESMLLLEAASYDLVIVETVGVGQSETAVARMTDLFLLLLLPGGGDELQGIKRGIVELADIILVNKADGALADAARHTVADYGTALRYLRRRTPDWTVPVRACSALEGDGIADAWSLICEFISRLRESGALAERRASQAQHWLWTELSASLLAQCRAHPTVRERLPEIERRVRSGELPPTVGARRLLDAFRNSGFNQD